MSLRKRWMTLPWDARLGFAAPSCFALWLALVVAAGPNLILLMSGCLAYPLLAAVALIVAFRLAVGPHRRQRVLPLALVSGCLAATVASPPGMTTDLHLVARIYAAGGPGTVNAWGQGLIPRSAGGGPVPDDRAPRTPARHSEPPAGLDQRRRYPVERVAAGACRVWRRVLPLRRGGVPHGVCPAGRVVAATPRVAARGGRLPRGLNTGPAAQGLS